MQRACAVEWSWVDVDATKLEGRVSESADARCVCGGVAEWDCFLDGALRVLIYFSSQIHVRDFDLLKY
jgi:hypothetical protein